MALLDGAEVAAINPLPETMRAAGAPPVWMSYVTVADADATAARATELGGQIYNGPFDVLTAGRMAVLADPQGAVLSVWQPRDTIGAQRVNEPGTLTWNDLATHDGPGPGVLRRPVRLDLRGPGRPVRRHPPRRAQQRRAAAAVARRGGHAARTGSRTSRSTDVEALAATASEHGGARARRRPSTSPPGASSSLADPQGAAFALVEASFDD